MSLAFLLNKSCSALWSTDKENAASATLRPLSPVSLCELDNRRIIGDYRAVVCTFFRQNGKFRSRTVLADARSGSFARRRPPSPWRSTLAVAPSVGSFRTRRTRLTCRERLCQAGAAIDQVLGRLERPTLGRLPWCRYLIDCRHLERREGK